MNQVNPRIEEDEPVSLGIALAVIQVALFFAFIGYCAFATQPASRIPGQGIPIHFIFGLLVILCGVMLTVVYVLVSNRRGPGHE